MSSYHEVRHYLNEILGYGFSIGIDLTDPGSLSFDCFLIVSMTKEIGENWRPTYLKVGHLQSLPEYFGGDDDEMLQWETEEIEESEPAQPPDFPASHVRQQLVSRGEAVYREYCQTCHGTRKAPFRQTGDDTRVGQVTPVEMVKTSPISVRRSSGYARRSRKFGLPKVIPPAPLTSI